MMMNWRNPKRTRDGKIEVEIEHPEYGWIPYSADPDDPLDIVLREGGNAPLHAVINQSGRPIAPADPEPPARAPMATSKLALIRALRRIQLDGQKVTSPQQTSAWEAVKAAMADAPEEIQEDWQSATRIPRDDPIMNELVATLPWPKGVSPEDVIDAAYTIAAEADRGDIGGGRVNPRRGPGLGRRPDRQTGA